MRKQEMKYYILACVGIPTSIFLFIVLLTFMTMADDLDKRIAKQEEYIHQARWGFRELNRFASLCPQTFPRPSMPEQYPIRTDIVLFRKDKQ